jgi:hypothetical protein
VVDFSEHVKTRRGLPTGIGRIYNEVDDQVLSYLSVKVPEVPLPNIPTVYSTC